MEVVLPLAIAAVVITALVKKTDIIGAFTEGARDGMKATAGILPVLMLMLTAIGVFRASGGMDILVWLLSPCRKHYRNAGRGPAGRGNKALLRFRSYCTAG